MPALIPFQTLRGKLAFFACLATLPAFVFVLYVAASERQATLQRVQNESLYVAESASREHAAQVYGAKRLLDTLVSHGARDGEISTLPVLLPALLSSFPLFANIGALTPEGEIEFSAIAPPRHINMAGVPAFQEALRSDEVVIGSYLVGLIVERPILIMTRALRSSRGHVQRVLFVALDLQWLDQLAKQTGLPVDSDLLIVDQNGSILASSLAASTESGAQSGHLTVAGATRHAVLRGMAQIRQTPNRLTRCQTGDGIPRLAVARPLVGLPGLWAVVGAPETKSDETVNAVFIRDVLALVFLTLLAIISSLIATDFSVLKDIRTLAQATRRFGRGEAHVRVPLPPSQGEIRNLIQSFNTMADTLMDQQQHMLFDQDRLRALTHQLQNAREEEAARIAQELHDDLGQELSVMRLELDRLIRRMASAKEESDKASLIQELQEFGGYVDAAVRKVRRISSELRPGVLDRLGLGAGIEWLLNQYGQRTHIETRFRVNGVERRVSTDMATALFRLSQEALSNIARHSQASCVEVELQYENEQIRLTIADNGDGFNPEIALSAPSLGLLGMQERTQRLGGSLEIHSAPGCGTKLVALVPDAIAAPF